MRRQRCFGKSTSNKVAVTTLTTQPSREDFPVTIEMISKETKLTERQRWFCVHFLNSRNATQAAIQAGYSKATASEQGYQLLHKTSVCREIGRLRKIRLDSVMLVGDDLVEKQMRIAFASIADVATFGTRDVPVLDPMTGRPAINPDGSQRFRKESFLVFQDSDSVDGSIISEVKIGKSGHSIKLQDAQKAIQWLTDYFGLNASHRHKAQYDAAVLALRERELALKEF